MKLQSRNVLAVLLNLQTLSDDLEMVAASLQNKAAIRLIARAIECIRKTEHYALEAVRAEEGLPSLIEEGPLSPTFKTGPVGQRVIPT